MKKSAIAKKIRLATLGRLVLLLVVVVAGVGSISPVRAEDQGYVNLSQFDLLTGSSGWVLLDGRLFRTSDAGQTWDDISPALPSGGAIRNVHFMDSRLGWVLFTTPDPNGGALFHLAHTTDGGRTWMMRTLPLFESGEIASFAEKTGMGWLDAQTGWISVKQASGSNFSIGTLFTTSDGGTTWSRSVLPVADRIVFSDPQTGWAAGGPTGDRVFKTQDGGLTWQNVSPDDAHENARVTAYAPFVSNADGLLVMTSVGAANSLNVYRADSSSNGWSPAGQVSLEVQPGVIGLSIIDARNFVAVIPGTNSIVRMKDDSLDVIENQDGLSDSIVALDMVSLAEGWAKSVESNCVDASSPNDSSVSVTCSSSTRFLRTTDGGVTWQSVPLPSTAGLDATRLTTFSTASRITTMNSLSNLGNSSIFIGQGFDACEIPTLSQMQTWALGSPYEAVNLYIGGSSRACDNAALTADYLKQLHAQGWKFIPTWVGPQAPCTGYLTKMSSDPAVAYTQGVAQADLAVERLAELGLTFPDKTGSVVYYDIEYYGTNTACRDAVSSFMNGWVSQIHARGNLAGVYASPACNTGLSDFRVLANPPDAVWIAAWYYNVGDPRATYDPTAGVWDWLGNCVTSDMWGTHQRIRQYSGDHDETWGGLTLEIDNDVLDGVTANAYVPIQPFPSFPPKHIVPTVTPKPRSVMRSKVLIPASITTEGGTTSGSLPSLGLIQQSGAEDDPAAYVSFQALDSPYYGYRSFHLPADTNAGLVSTMLLQVNFKTSSSAQIWTWSIYDWNTGMWINLGNTLGAEAGEWTTRVFRIYNLQRYTSPDGRGLRIQLRSNRSSGELKMDYEALHITYLPLSPTPVPTAPVFHSKRPMIFSSPTATPEP